jgi:hypothetical protein
VPSDRVAFRVLPSLARHLDARAVTWTDQTGRPSPGMAAQDGLGRYYRLLAAELRDARLTDAEASVLVGVLNGTHFDDTWVASGPVLLAEELREAVGDGLFAKWDIDDPKAFCDRVAGWSRGTALAVIDAIERFWRTPDLRQVDHTEALAAVGLIRR